MINSRARKRTELNLITFVILLTLLVCECNSVKDNITGVESINKENSYSQRKLAGSIDATKCLVTGAGVTSPIIVSQTNTVTLTARDSAGVNLGVGGDQVYISITNPCTRGSNMQCVPVSGATAVLANPINVQMTDNADGTYTYSYSVSVPGAITVAVVVITNIGVTGVYYNNPSLTPPSVSTLTTNQFYYDWGTGDISPNQADNVSVHFETTITPFVTDSYTFTLRSDAGNIWTFNGTPVTNNLNPIGLNTNRYNVNLNAFEKYPIVIDFADWGGNAECKLFWNTTTISNQTIPANNLSFATDAASSPYQIVVNCQTGYMAGGPSLTTCVTKCGDGLKFGAEKCDDGNTASSDGCSADCTAVEAGWVCAGGSTTSKDVCTFCTSGLYQNDASTPTSCVAHCGDGKVAGFEKCDDGNTISGDGCSADCSTVESGWVCSGGSATVKDVCMYCTTGFYQNSLSNPTTCVTHCGDGIRTGSEKCDDGNTVNGDGCSSDCLTIESSWVCTGGSLTSKDTCTKCYSSAGYYQNNPLNPRECVTHCGDGIRAGSEKCDDGNNISGDGCSSDCSSIDSGWACSLNQTQAKDICTFCTSGLYQNNPSNPTLCVPHCGDSKVASIEACDDGNMVTGDGCASNCETIENNWICINGNTTHKSDCSECDVGYAPNSDHSKCNNAELNIETKTQLIIIASLLTTGLIANVVFGLIGVSSFQSMFCGLNQMQLILLLPLIGPFVPSKVVQFIAGTVSFINLKAIFNPFEFFRENIHILSIAFNDFTYNQRISYLSLIEFENQSTLNNMISYIFILFLFFTIHFIVLLCSKIFIKAFKRIKLLNNIAEKLYKCFTLGLYIRWLFEIYLYILIACLSELYLFRFNNTDHLASKIISAIVFAFCIFVIVVCLLLILIGSPTVSVSRHRPCGHCFDGLQRSKLRRVHALLFFVRRTAFCMLILLFADLAMLVKVWLYAAMQFAYLTTVCVLRPFEQKKDNVIEIINEFIYLILCLILTYLNAPERWSIVLQYVYICIIIANNLIIVIFAILSICFKKKILPKPQESGPINTDNKLVNDKSQIEDISMNDRMQSNLSHKQLQSANLQLRRPNPGTNYMYLSKAPTPPVFKLKSRRPVDFVPRHLENIHTSRDANKDASQFELNNKESVDVDKKFKTHRFNS